MGNHITADQALLRKLNTSRILECLRTSGPLSRAGLSGKTGLNRSTVSSVISELLRDNLVRETGLQSSRGGRPGLLLELNPQGGYAIGVEIGVDFVSIILTNFIAETLWRRRITSDAEDRPQVIIERTETLIRKALDAGRQRELRPLGIGLGVPGLVDLRKGELIFAPNLGWRNVPFPLMWSERFGVPVFIENEANAAALGEYYFGAARHVENLIYLSIGVGLGGGIIIKGKLFRGSNGFAGEVGHTTVVPDGLLCGCGKQGCWETLVGPRAIIRRVRKAIEEKGDNSISALVANDLDQIDLDVVIQAAHAGDSVALTAFEEVGVQLGIGISNLVNTFNPELVVLGGSLNVASPFLLPAIEQMIQKHTLEQLRDTVKVTISAHSVDACVMGAVALVLDDILREPLPC